MKRRFFAGLLSLILCLGLLLVPAAAAGGKLALGISTDNIANHSADNCDYVYFGTRNGEPIKWMVVDTRASSYVNSKSILLLSVELMDYIPFGSTKTWQGSNAQQWCQNFYNTAFTDAEKSVIRAVTASDDYYDISGVPPFAAADNILNGDHVFFLSAQEMNSYGFTDETRKSFSNYWLRSPTYYADQAVGVVWSNGGFAAAIVSSSQAYARPAICLDRDKIELISSPTAKQNSTLGQFSSIPEYNGNEWKLTIRDSSRSSFTAKAGGLDGNTFTVAYSGAVAGPNEYISAYIRDDSNSLYYYGRLQQVSSSNGTVTITLPNGSYTYLQIFNEHIDADSIWDYSSDGKEFFSNKNVPIVDMNLTGLSSGNSMTYIDVNRLTGQWGQFIGNSINSDYTATLTPEANYELPDSIEVSFNGTTLTAGSDYTYNSSTGKLTVTKTKMNEIGWNERNNAGNLVITATGRLIIGTPSPSLTSSAPGKATASWNTVTGAADGYTVQLYNGSTPVGSAVETTATSCNFNITSEGNYRVEVKAKGIGDVTGSAGTASLTFYKVEFKNGNSTVSTQYVAQNNTATLPSDQMPSGTQYFDGWEYDGAAFTSETPVNANITVTAKFVDKGTQAAVAPSQTAGTTGSVTVSTVNGQKYAITDAGANAPASDATAWVSVSGSSHTFSSGLHPGTAYTVWSYKPGDTTHLDSDPVSTTVYTAPAITTASLTNGTVDEAYNVTLGKTASVAVTWVAGNLPDGLGINTSTGTISGTPTTAVTSQQVTITATIQGTSISTSKTMNLTVNPARINGTVTIQGNAVVGQALTADYTGNAGNSVSYQWKRDGMDISGATSKIYTLTAADAGKTISVTVTGTGNYQDSLDGDGRTVEKITSSIAITGAPGRAYNRSPVGAPEYQITGGSTGAVTFTWEQKGTDGNYTQLSSAPTDVGDYRVTAHLAATATHKGATSEAVEFTIDKATPTLSDVTATPITYGDTVGSSTIGGTATLNGQSVEGSFSWSADDGSEKPAVADSKNNYTVTFTPEDTANYTTATAQITLTVNKKELTVSATANNKPYDGKTDTTGNIILTGAVNGEEPTASGVFNFADENAGENKTVNVTDIALDSNNPVNANYVLNAGTLTGDAAPTATISPRMVELEWSGLGSDWTHIYNGQAVNITARVTNLQRTTDTCTVTVSGGVQTNANVDGGHYTATATNLTGAQAANYTLDGCTNTTQTYYIVRANASVTAPTAKTLTYNGDKQALVEVGASPEGTTLLYAVTDTETAPEDSAYDTGIPTGKDAGTYHVWYKVDGGTNYNNVGAQRVPVTIGQKEVGLTWSGHENRVYGDGMTVTAEATGVEAGDTCTVTVTGGNQTSAGEHTARATGLSNDNYKLPSNVIQTYTITAQGVPVPAADPTTYTYNGQAQIYTLTEDDRYTIEGATQTAAGTYTVTVTLNDKANYAWETGGTENKEYTFTIQKAPLTIAVSGNELTYNGLPRQANVTVSGIQNDEAAADVYAVTYQAQGTADGSASVTSAGTYDIWVALSDDNYKFVNKDDATRGLDVGDLTIAKAPLTVAVDESSLSLTYDGQYHTAAVTVSGIQNNEVAESVYSITYPVQGQDSGAASVIDAGTYDVLITLSNDNYKFAEQDDTTRSMDTGDLTIAPKGITVSWTKIQQTFGAVTHPEPVFTGVVVREDAVAGADGTRPQETVNVSFDYGRDGTYGDTVPTNAGSYPFTAVSLNPNYTITAGASNTLTIGRQTVYFTVTGSAYVEGETKAPAITPSVSGVSYTISYRQNGQTVGNGINNFPSAVGTYEIWAAFDSSGNYQTASGLQGRIGTYTVSAPTDQEVVSGTIISLPSNPFTHTAGTGAERYDFIFTGWSDGGSTLYQPGDLYTVSRNVTLTAQWRSVYHITGSVVDTEGNPVSGAVVRLMFGAQQIAEASTNANGEYEFDHVIPGIYNLVVSHGERTITTMETITDHNETNTAILPAIPTNSIVSVQSAVPVVVGNLEKTFGENDVSTATNGGKVEMTFTAQEKAADDAAIQTGIEAIQETAASNVTLGLVMDYSVQKDVYKNSDSSPTSTPVTETSTLLTLRVTLPGSLQGMYSYHVYRYHGTEAEALERSDGTKEGFQLDSDGATLIIYAQKFSTYAIGYVENAPSSGATRYPPVVTEPDNGSVTVSPSRPASGQLVTIRPEPEEGYEVDEVTVTTSRGTEIAVTDNGDGTYSFRQPSGSVTITVTFKETGAAEAACPRDGTCPLARFTDVTLTAWYHDGIHYCVEHGLMGGTSATTFEPDTTTSRAMIAVILWRQAGSPIAEEYTDFSDVAEGAWYTQAVRWASSAGVVGGYPNGSFGPNDPITREQMAVMLYRYAQYQGVETVTLEENLAGFTDADKISGYAIQPMNWAVGQGIMGGYGDGTLGPQGNATRAQAAAMLQRFCERIGTETT